MLERVAVGAVLVATAGLAVLHFSDRLALDIAGGVLLVTGALTELLATIYSVATRGLFGGRDDR